MYNTFDDFDTQITPEELQCDNPIDSDFEPDFETEFGDTDEFPDEYPLDEGSDRDNWEDNQVFLDNEGNDIDDSDE